MEPGSPGTVWNSTAWRLPSLLILVVVVVVVVTVETTSPESVSTKSPVFLLKARLRSRLTPLYWPVFSTLTMSDGRDASEEELLT